VKYILQIFLVFGLITIFASCSSKSGETASAPAVPDATVIRTIKAADFKSGMESNPNHLLLDVRTIAEYETEHIDSSMLIPVQELEQRLNEIIKWKSLPVFVYCRTGNRSMTAAKMLSNAGFSEIYNLEGGIGGWTREGFATVK